VGSTLSSDVLSEGRQAMAQETQERLQRYLDSYETGIAITLVNILKAEPPAAVKSAFDDVISAKEDKDRFVNEAKTYANGVVPEARGKAQRIIQEAIGYRERLVAEADGEAQRFNQLYTEYRKAPEVTRERLYLNSVEKVMSSVSKVLIDVEGGNNMMYLPLDKLTSQTPTTVAAGGRSQQSDMVSQVANEVIDRLRREQARTRRPEGR
jgi:membrane protease subunit HflK